MECVCVVRERERWRGGVCMCSERDQEMWRGGVCMCTERERERDVERWSVYVY